MTKSPAHVSLDRLLAVFLQAGTWIACGLIGAGLVLQAWPVLWAAQAMTAGVALFVLLPVMRVALLLAVFARQRNMLYAALATAVLAVIAAGCVLGVRLGPLAG
ncbi:DUF1634 domain-containing protein [Caballeronia sp. LZ043]|uniref:DUF1634 domain-containing protein n=1 Tax=Caballeronia sp. LZ043 TaxID=3038569 RepID=UPI002855A0DF|nr:DUF1634 domain-containing protein [Caballeronia sp. LZ043]MDR5821544.1 DUF1634 domain-containing protein [Caballeronia sp. LZ043]